MGEGGTEELDAEDGEVDKSSEDSDDDSLSSVGLRLNLGGFAVCSGRRTSCDLETVSKRGEG